MKKVILSIDGMTCSACSNGLEKYLNKQKDVKQATVNLVMNTARIEYDDKKLSLADLDRFVEEAGFKSLGIDTFEKEQRNNSNEKYKLIAITCFSLLTLYVSMSHMLGLPVIPFLNMMDYPLNYAICLLVLTVIVMTLGRSILKNGIKNLIHRTPNMDTLVTIGVFASFIYSLYGTVQIIRGQVDYVENLYFESAAIVIFFIEIGKFIENKNKNKTKEALQRLMTITPKNATIIREGAEWKVTLDEIQKGDIVICKPGEKIAVDGTIIDGTTHIDESFITGESVPVKREIGSKVIAGSINYEGTIKYKAEKIGKESTVSEIVRLVHEATNTKAPIAKIADTVSSYFVPVIIILAVIAFAIWCTVTKDFAFSVNIFVSILVIACPCSLGLATPLAIVIASGLCSQKGILVKSSESLENANKVKTICFDKTGTLTKGNLSISKIYNYSTEDDIEVIKQVASIESKSEHPIARAIVNYANDKNITLEKVINFKNIPGYGVYAKISDDEFYIGNRRLMEEKQIDLDSGAKETGENKSIDEAILNVTNNEKDLTEAGNSILFVSKNQKLIALIGVRDGVRDNIKETIQKLKDKNIDVVMLTGDNEKTANYIAKEIRNNKCNGKCKTKRKGR